MRRTGTRFIFEGRWTVTLLKANIEILSGGRRWPVGTSGAPSRSGPGHNVRSRRKHGGPEGGPHALQYYTHGGRPYVHRIGSLLYRVPIFKDFSDSILEWVAQQSEMLDDIDGSTCLQITTCHCI